MLDQPLPELNFTSPLYDQDFYLWTQQSAAALRSHHWDQLDIDNLVEEIESLGKSDQRALKSRLEVLLMHLLKWSYQSNQRSNSWRATMTEQRLRIQDLLSDSPSLKPYLDAELPGCYHNARKLAADETGLDRATFPEACPYQLTSILDENYRPE